jgi:hypothetical protein
VLSCRRPVIDGYEDKGESQHGASWLVENDYSISSLVPNLNGEGSGRSPCPSAETYEITVVRGEVVVQGEGSIGWKQRWHQQKPFERQFEEFTGDIRADKAVDAWQA